MEDSFAIHINSETYLALVIVCIGLMISVLDGQGVKLNGYKFSIWLIWDFTGFRYIFSKILPNTDKDSKNAPSTFILWIVGVYVALFGLASQRYENKIEKIENRTNGIITQMAIPDLRRQALMRIPKIQNTLSPVKPDFLLPTSIIKSLFMKPEQYHEMVDTLKQVILDSSDLLGSLPPERTYDSGTHHLIKSLDLSSVHLNGVNFGTGINMYGIILKNANLAGISLRYSDLRGSNLESANLKGSTLIGVQLTNANLNYSNLSGSNLREGRVDKAEVREAILDNIYALDASFSGSNLLKVKMRNASLGGANFSGANLLSSDLTGSELDDASFKNAQLNSVKFIGAFLSGVDFTGAECAHADFSDAKLFYANFTNTDFYNSNLLKAKSLNPSDLCKSKRLYKAKLPPEVYQYVLDNCPDRFGLNSDNQFKPLQHFILE